MEIYFPLIELFDFISKIDIFYNNCDGEWVVTDWKTSKDKKDHTKQLATYFYAIRKKTQKNIKRLKCHIVYLALENGEHDLEKVVEEYILEESDIDFLECRIESTINKIGNLGVDTEKWRKKCGPLCNHCDFKIEGHCDGISECE